MDKVIRLLTFILYPVYRGWSRLRDFMVDLPTDRTGYARGTIFILRCPTCSAIEGKSGPLNEFHVGNLYIFIEDIADKLRIPRQDIKIKKIKALEIGNIQKQKPGNIRIDLWRPRYVKITPIQGTRKLTSDEIDRLTVVLNNRPDLSALYRKKTGGFELIL